MEHATVKHKHRIIRYSIIAIILLIALYKGAQFMWGEHYLTFFKGIIRNPVQVGAVSPASVFVAQEITRFIAHEPSEKPLKILEVGGGSGVFTTYLEKVLRGRVGEYQVDVIEIDPEYCEILRKRFSTNNHFVIHCINILDFNPDYKYDYIVSSLPFNTFEQPFIEQVLDRYKAMIIPEGILSYVEHMWFPAITEFFKQGSDKKQFSSKRKMLTNFKDRYLHETGKVYCNITPLYVFHLKMP